MSTTMIFDLVYWIVGPIVLIALTDLVWRKVARWFTRKR